MLPNVLLYESILLTLLPGWESILKTCAVEKLNQNYQPGGELIHDISHLGLVHTVLYHQYRDEVFWSGILYSFVTVPDAYLTAFSH